MIAPGRESALSRSRLIRSTQRHGSRIMAKRFTLSQAQSLIAKVSPLLQSAIELKSQYSKAERAFQEFSQRIMVTGGLLVDRERPLELRQRRDTAGQKLRETISEVQEFGCVIKDLEIGLLDFPTLFRGREVYLCWKLGEPCISYWHGVDEGFAGRKEIDQDFREHHRGDRPQ